MKKMVVVVFITLLTSCTTYRYNLTPGYTPPDGKELAVEYVAFDNNAMSSNFTKLLEEQLSECGKINYLHADEVEDILGKKKIDVPKRINATNCKAIRDALNVRFLLRSSISNFKSFDGMSKAEATGSISIYDLDNGSLVFEAYGSETGGTIFSTPEGQVKDVFYYLLRKWDGFCVYR